MKWDIYSTPEFCKLMFSETISGKSYLANERSLIVFTNFLQKKLNTFRKFENDKEYKLYIGSKDDTENIIKFAQFYIRSVRDPLTGVCAYESIMNRVKCKGIEPNLPLSTVLGGFNKSIAYEVFKLTARNNKPDIDIKNQYHSIAVTITGVNTEKGNEYVKIECISFV